MKLEKETSIYQPGAIAGKFEDVEDFVATKNSIFHQPDAPSTSGRKVGDIWYDSDDGYSMYKFDGTTWVREQYGTNAISAGAITAARLDAQDVYTNFLRVYFLSAAQAEIDSLSAITANLGSVNVGGLNNEDGVITIKNASDQTIGYWDNTGIHATAGKIGGANGWDIGTGYLRASYTNSGTKYVGMGITGVTYAFFANASNADGSDGVFRVAHSGHLTATSATITGTITATGGSIAGWTIGGSALTKGTLGANDSIQLGTADLGSATIAGKSLSTWRLAVGSGFGVDKNGVLYASGAQISGNITVGGANNSNGTITVKDASNGTLGTWDNSGLSLLYTSSGRYITFGASGNRGYLEYDSFYNRFVAPKEIGWSLNSYNKAQVSVMSTSANTGSLILRAYDASDNAYGFMINPTDGIYAIGDITATGSVIFSNASVAHIFFANNLATISMIRFLPGSDGYGHGISIGGGGATIIGGGESATACQGLLTNGNGDERMIVANDGDIEFYANCQNGVSTADIMTYTGGGIYIRNSALTKGTNPSSETNRGITFTDKNSYSSAAVNALSIWYGGGVNTAGLAYSIIRQYKYAANNSDYIQFNLNYPASGTPYAELSTGNFITNNGNIYATISSGEVSINARNSASGNLIQLWANSSTGVCGIWSRGANGTSYSIISRANNSHNITASGAWTFNGSAQVSTGSSSANFLVGCNVSGYSSRNAIWLDAYTGGVVRIGSQSADGTSRPILDRANNSHAITTYGNWYFSANAVFNGNLYSRISTSNAWIQAENVNGGNAIAIEAHTDGTVVLWSRGANGTSYYILSRANNSHTITTYGDWTFNGTLKCKNYAGNAGRPVTSASTDGKQVSAFECVNSTTLHVSGQWGTTGSSFAWRNATVSTSDIRLKENIADSTVTALPLVNSIRMREFDWKEDGRHQKIGFIADELEKLDRKLAIGGGYDADGSMDIKSVDTFYLLGYAIKAIQELSTEINRLKGEMYEESGNSRNRISIHC